MAIAKPVFCNVSIVLVELLSVEFMAKPQYNFKVYKINIIIILTGISDHLVSSIVSGHVIIPSNFTIEIITRHISSDVCQC